MEKDLEPVYDEQIAPLMAQIIAITKEHQMPFVVVFHLRDDEDEGPLLCSSALVPRGSASSIVRCYNIVTGAHAALLTVVRGKAEADG